MGIITLIIATTLIIIIITALIIDTIILIGMIVTGKEQLTILTQEELV
jgi:hypothetical protein